MSVDSGMIVFTVNAILSLMKCHHTGNCIIYVKKKNYSFISKIYVSYGHLVYENKL